MEFLKKFDLTLPQLAKIVGLVALALVILSFAVQFLGIGQNNGSRFLENSVSTLSTKMQGIAGNDMYMSEPRYDSGVMNETGSIYPPIGGGYTPGDVAEDFEVKEYYAYIETRDKERDCGAVQALKTRTDVIFENANVQARGCSFTFKVKNANVESVLAVVNSLNPEELTANIYTIKRQLDSYTNEIGIIEKKLSTIEETLDSSLAAYNEITKLASRTENADALAKVISSKVSIIRQLTDERLQTSAELERLSRARSDELDRLEYTNFSVNITENKFVDGTDIKNSWKLAVKKFVNETNTLIQDLSIGLISFILTIVQLMIYFFIVVFVARFGFVVTKRIWKKE